MAKARWPRSAQRNHPSRQPFARRSASSNHRVGLFAKDVIWSASASTMKRSANKAAVGRPSPGVLRGTRNHVHGRRTTEFGDLLYQGAAAAVTGRGPDDRHARRRQRRQASSITVRDRWPGSSKPISSTLHFAAFAVASAGRQLRLSVQGVGALRNKRVWCRFSWRKQALNLGVAAIKAAYEPQSA
jgi:hypothetical protein